MCVIYLYSAKHERRTIIIAATDVENVENNLRSENKLLKQNEVGIAYYAEEIVFLVEARKKSNEHYLFLTHPTLFRNPPSNELSKFLST